MLRTNRGLIKYLLLSIITFGIYGLVVFCHIGEEINKVASRRDGKRTMHFALIAFLLGPLTLGIGYLVWYHKICSRIGDELMARGINYSFGAANFWCWDILGTIIIIGPFVFVHQILKAMNLINADYNVKGDSAPAASPNITVNINVSDKDSKVTIDTIKEKAEEVAEKFQDAIEEVVKDASEEVSDIVSEVKEEIAEETKKD